LTSNGNPRLTPEELYEIRLLELEQAKALLALNKQRLRLAAALLKLERKYKLLASDNTLDTQTGKIHLSQ